MKNTNKKITKGFTLIELLVVVLIIGILAAIALPQYKMAVAKSRYATMMDLTKAIAYAQDRYFMVHGTHTNNFNDLDIEMPQNYISKTTKEYCYDWGECSIAWTNSLVCYNYQIGAGLFIYLKNQNQYSEVKTGKAFCVSNSVQDDDFSNKLCKQITNQDTYTAHESFWLGCNNQTYHASIYQFSSY